MLQPIVVIITTPNSDFNIDFPLPPGKFRHPDHKFEWSTEEFKRFCTGVAWNFGFKVVYDGYGIGKNGIGCTQVAVFIHCLEKHDQARQKHLLRCGNIYNVVTQVFDELEKKPNSRRLYTFNAKPCFEKKDTENFMNIDKVLNQLYNMDLPIDRMLSFKSHTDVLHNAVEMSRHMSNTAEESETVSAVSARDSESCPRPQDLDCPGNYYSDKYFLVQEQIYHDVYIMFYNEVMHRITGMVWCINPQNNYYPFEDKLQKLDIDWDYLDIINANTKTKLRHVIPVQKPAKCLHDVKARAHCEKCLTSCSLCHDTYKRYCSKCRFLHVHKVFISNNKDLKRVTCDEWQSHVVYQTSRYLFFSFVLVLRYLNIANSKENLAVIRSVLLRSIMKMTSVYQHTNIKTQHFLLI